MASAISDFELTEKENAAVNVFKRELLHLREIRKTGVLRVSVSVNQGGITDMTVEPCFREYLTTGKK